MPLMTNPTEVHEKIVSNIGAVIARLDGIYFALGTRSEKLLAGLRDWMTAHNAVIMSVLCLIIAAKLIGDGIGGLAG